MKSLNIYSGFLTVLLASLFVTATAQESPRNKLLIDDGWRFKKGEPANAPDLSYNTIKDWILPTGNELLKNSSKKVVRPESNPGVNFAYVQGDFDDSNWKKVELPHDWAIGGPFTHEGGGGMGCLPTSGVGWYRRKITISKKDLGKSIFLDVDGAMSYASVWVNGKLAGGWPYGYTSWRMNLSPYVKRGGNQLAIRLDNPPNSSRWYTGAGLYRNVWLDKTAPVHVGHWGVFVETKSVSIPNAEIKLTVAVDNDSKKVQKPIINSEFFLLDENGQKTEKAVAEIQSEALQIQPGKDSSVTATVNIANPKRWGPKPNQTPHRYLAVTTIRNDGKSLGRKKKSKYEYRFRWDSVRYEPGKLKVLTYKNGKKWATDVVRTAGKPATLKLTADRETINTDGNDLSYVTLRVLDGRGTFVPNADNHIRFEISGPGEIVSTANGDPTNFTSFHSHERDAFNGKVLVVVRSKEGKQGTIKVTAKSNRISSGPEIITTQ